MSDSSFLTSPQSQAATAPGYQLTEAIKECEQALQGETSLATACQVLGNVLQGMGRFQDTLFWHTLAQENQPDPAVVYASLGRLCARQRRWQQAIEYYEQAILRDPSLVMVHRNLANLYAQQGQREKEAEHRYQTVVLKPEWANPRNQLKLGNLLVEFHRLEQAIECYRRGVQLDPDSFEIQYNLAVALTSHGQWQEAIDAYRRAIEINPEHADSYYGICKAAEQQSDLDTAVEYCRRTVELDPTAFPPCYTLGTLLLKQCRWEEAVAAYQRALEIYPDFGWTYHNLGYALLRQGAFAPASEMLQRAIALLPDSLWSHYHLAEALSGQQQWNDAIRVFLDALHLQPDQAAIYPKLGHLVRKRLQADVEVAIEQYQQTLVPDASAANFYTQVGAKLNQLQLFDGAYFFYRLALYLKPNHPDLYTKVQKAWDKRDRLNKQIATLQRRVERFPKRSDFCTKLGNLLTKHGEFEQAMQLHRQAGLLKGWQCAAQEYCFTHDWFTHNIANWRKHLKAQVGQEINALEVGSFEGMSACWLLDNLLTHPSAKLTCIDLYFQEFFDSNIAKTGAAQKVTKLIGDSHQLLPTLAAEAYDLIYIDGCRFASHVQQDALLAWKLLKPGGFIIFDAYKWADKNHPGQDTKIGVDAFLESVQSHIEVLHQGYQIIGRRIL